MVQAYSGVSEDQVLTHDCKQGTLTHISVSETNKLKQGETWAKEETAGNNYLGLRFLFLGLCSKIFLGSILFAFFDEAKLT